MRGLPRHISAALAALKFSGARREELRSLEDSEWKDLLSFCDLAHLTIPLSRVCGDDLPPWVRSRIAQNLADNARRFERIKEVYEEFARASRDAGAEHLVIKGFAQWPGFVEDPRFRLQSDIDVYCPHESIFRARDALSMLGYEPQRGLDFTIADHLPTMVLKTSWKWRGNLYDPEIPVSFELHSCFWNERVTGVLPQGLDRFWSRRVDRRLDNISFPGLNDVDNLGYTALNLTRNLLRDGPSPHQIYELAWFLDRHADDDQLWKRWRESHDDSLRSLETISFRLAFHCFSCRLPEALEREIESLPTAVKTWCDEFQDFSFTGQLRPNKVGLWLHLSLLESSADKLSVLRKRLFPTRVPEIEVLELLGASSDQETGRRSPLSRHTEYLVHVISRIGYHASILPPTLWHGARWWWSTKKLGRAFWNFLAVSFLYDLGMFIFFFLYNLYLLDRGFHENFIGLVVSATAIGSVAGTIPAGMLARRLGLQKTVLLCMVLVSLVSVLRSVLATEVGLLALAFLGGASSTIWAVSISPAIANLTSEANRPLGFSLVFSSGIAIGIFGGQMGGLLPGWLARIHPFVASYGSKQAALLTACGIVALATWPASRLKFASVPFREKKFFPRNRFVFRFLPAIAVWSLVTGAFSPFFNTYFSQYLRMPLERIGVVTSVSQVSQALAVLVAPFVFEKFGVVPGIVYTQIATAIALGCLAAVPGASAAAVVYAGYMALQWMSEPGMYSLLMSRVTPSEQAGASALNFLVISLAQAIAAAASGISFVRFGYPAVLSVTAGVALVAALLFRILLGSHPQSAEGHPATASCEQAASVAGSCFHDSIEG